MILLLALVLVILLFDVDGYFAVDDIFTFECFARRIPKAS